MEKNILENVEKTILEFHESDNEENLKTWSEVFKLLEHLNACFKEFKTEIYNILDFNSNFDKILGKSINRIFRNYNEIVCLLKNGFPEAALARWRTLYENIIIVIYILMQDDKERMANSYIENQEIIDLKNLKKYIEYSEKSESELEKINIKVEDLDKENLNKKVKDYSWSGKNSFKEIQDSINIGDYYIYYATASWCIHSGNYKSLILLESYEGDETYLRSKYLTDLVIGVTIGICTYFFLNIIKYKNINKNENIKKLLELLLILRACILKKTEKIIANIYNNA
ncbi:DUF5677 domain-containing protein [Clostridium perfringens]|uniref:DUF5677 domain-containing protein n=1 Tax=Clostridium perfringens TaxID=1502 RepID=UPI001F06079C|nr:DUF5677 domain-containing protein [Clostridium perfringens]MCH1962973.1 DUF5677 domain-containing protein [Clostridium perfringens]